MEVKTSQDWVTSANSVRKWNLGGEEEAEGFEGGWRCEDIRQSDLRHEQEAITLRAVTMRGAIHQCNHRGETATQPALFVLPLSRLQLFTFLGTSLQPQGINPSRPRFMSDILMLRIKSAIPTPRRRPSKFLRYSRPRVSNDGDHIPREKPEPIGTRTLKLLARNPVKHTSLATGSRGSCKAECKQPNRNEALTLIHS